MRRLVLLLALSTALVLAALYATFGLASVVALYTSLGDVCLELPDASRFEAIPLSDVAPPDTLEDVARHAPSHALLSAQLSNLEGDEYGTLAASFRLYRVLPLHGPPDGSDERSSSGEGDALPNASVSARRRLALLFVHGHRGSREQANALATALAWQPHASRAALPIDVFAADLAASSSAYSAGLLAAQARFVARCIAALVRRYGARGAARASGVTRVGGGERSGLVVLGHSMGGVVARVALALLREEATATALSASSRAQPPLPSLLLTLNSPHARHPYSGDAAMEALYAALRAAETTAGGTAVERSTAEAASRAAVEADRPLSPRPPFAMLPASKKAHLELPPETYTLLSLTSGSRDLTVRPPLTAPAQTRARRSGDSTDDGNGVAVESTSLALSLTSASVPGAWLECGHDGIVNCGLFVAALAAALQHYAQTLARGGGSGGDEGALGSIADATAAARESESEPRSPQALLSEPAALPSAAAAHAAPLYAPADAAAAARLVVELSPDAASRVFVAAAPAPALARVAWAPVSLSRTLPAADGSVLSAGGAGGLEAPNATGGVAAASGVSRGSTLCGALPLSLASLLLRGGVSAAQADSDAALSAAARDERAVLRLVSAAQLAAGAPRAPREGGGVTVSDSEAEAAAWLEYRSLRAALATAPLPPPTRAATLPRWASLLQTHRHSGPANGGWRRALGPSADADSGDAAAADGLQWWHTAAHSPTLLAAGSLALREWTAADLWAAAQPLRAAAAAAAALMTDSDSVDAGMRAQAQQRRSSDGGGGGSGRGSPSAAVARPSRRLFFCTTMAAAAASDGADGALLRDAWERGSEGHDLHAPPRAAPGATQFLDHRLLLVEAATALGHYGVSATGGGAGEPDATKAAASIDRSPPPLSAGEEAARASSGGEARLSRGLVTHLDLCGLLQPRGRSRPQSASAEESAATALALAAHSREASARFRPRRGGLRGLSTDALSRALGGTFACWPSPYARHIIRVTPRARVLPAARGAVAGSGAPPGPAAPCLPRFAPVLHFSSLPLGDSASPACADCESLTLPPLAAPPAASPQRAFRYVLQLQSRPPRRVVRIPRASRTPTNEGGGLLGGLIDAAGGWGRDSPGEGRVAAAAAAAALQPIALSLVLAPSLVLVADPRCSYELALDESDSEPDSSAGAGGAAAAFSRDERGEPHGAASALSLLYAFPPHPVFVRAFNWLRHHVAEAVAALFALALLVVAAAAEADMPDSPHSRPLRARSLSTLPYPELRSLSFFESCLAATARPLHSALSLWAALAAATPRFFVIAAAQALFAAAALDAAGESGGGGGDGLVALLVSALRAMAMSGIAGSARGSEISSAAELERGTDESGGGLGAWADGDDSGAARASGRVKLQVSWRASPLDPADALALAPPVDAFLSAAAALGVALALLASITLFAAALAGLGAAAARFAGPLPASAKASTTAALHSTQSLSSLAAAPESPASLHPPLNPPPSAIPPLSLSESSAAAPESVGSGARLRRSASGFSLTAAPAASSAPPPRSAPLRRAAEGAVEGEKARACAGDDEGPSAAEPSAIAALGVRRASSAQVPSTSMRPLFSSEPLRHGGSVLAAPFLSRRLRSASPVAALPLRLPAVALTVLRWVLFAPPAPASPPRRGGAAEGGSEEAHPRVGSVEGALEGALEGAAQPLVAAAGFAAAACARMRFCLALGALLALALCFCAFPWLALALAFLAALIACLCPCAGRCACVPSRSSAGRRRGSAAPTGSALAAAASWLLLAALVLGVKAMALIHSAEVAAAVVVAALLGGPHEGARSPPPAPPPPPPLLASLSAAHPYHGDRAVVAPLLLLLLCATPLPRLLAESLSPLPRALARPCAPLLALLQSLPLARLRAAAPALAAALAWPLGRLALHRLPLLAAAAASAHLAIASLAPSRFAH